MRDLSQLRADMVENQIEARGIKSSLVLAALRKVPREAFISDRLREFAYEDSPLPIAAGQTISQPYIVALMTEALGLAGGEKILEIGTGSGYAAAVLGEIAAQVYTVERIGELAETASAALKALGYDNIHVLHADGSLGWPPEAPYDAIIVTAGGPEVPQSLKEQLKIGGRLVIPVGINPRAQELVRVTRLPGGAFKSEDLADVRFVPLIGNEGWSEENAPAPPEPGPARRRLAEADIVGAISVAAEPFGSIGEANLERLLERIGDAKIVLLGEASHGTAEFYLMRQRISQELIERKGFRFVAIEGDWPDVARLDHYVRHFEYPPSEWTAFARFPAWMWRNKEMRSFVDWLHAHNKNYAAPRRIAFYGLDLYSLYTSIGVILKYLDEVDPDSAKIARERYGCLTPWQSDPATYGRAASNGNLRNCEAEVVRMLEDIVRKQSDYTVHDGERFMDAMQNARLVSDAERYYRIMYQGSRASWNLRDNHMFETLKALLDFHGTDAKAIVWAHNSHIGNAAATEMAARGEFNIGQLCKGSFGDGAYAIGFGTHSGTVAAASSWDGVMEIKSVRPSLPQSYERLCHETGHPRFMLPLRAESAPRARAKLLTPHLERAIGVIYRPETERGSHYFQAVLPEQFDEYVWFDSTQAVTPFETKELEGLPDTYPFGL
ncbi:protein-L-isoaspartate O-methyltransferase [Acidocella aquatica]|uniref:Protein-L-isoaspartate O-methyltransferase n=1 Tax=Acidocella aquatica TaxID=1922313 RepID=A0ABQ6A7X8_9PROT|nr:protein-L-isoaspartate(D-aspartate) O-methyltransferase [Acidocella aquatica]GLR68314.1 protein-L-isoaspartate O-methyltransferase [Acidocella aquatica]